MAFKSPLVADFEDIVQITHIENGPYKFWVTLESEGAHFSHLLTAINNEAAVPYQGQLNKEELVKIEYDGTFWRGLLVGYNRSNDMYAVELLDLGKCIEVSRDSFYEFQLDYSSFGYFAHLVTLHMASETLNAKDPRIKDWFCQLVNSQSEFRMKVVTPPTANRNATCQLYLKGSQSMVEALQDRQHMRYRVLHLDPSMEHEVQISSVTNKLPWSFGARLASSEAELVALQSDLEEYCTNQALPLTVIPKPEEPIFALYSDQWYRAKTRQVISTPHIHVELVDFGIRFIVDENDACLADYRLVTKLARQSFQCRLSGVDNLPVAQKFLSLTRGKNFKMSIVDSLETTEELLVHLIDTSVTPAVDIGQQLLAIAELSKKKPEAIDSIWDRKMTSESSGGYRSQDEFLEQDSQQMEPRNSHLDYNRWDGGHGDSFSHPRYLEQETRESPRPMEIPESYMPLRRPMPPPLRRPMLKPSVGKKALCFVVYTESPDDFYIQLDDWQKQLESMKARIAHRCQEAGAPPFQTLYKGASCLARSQLDQVWYRAKVQEIYPSSKCIFVKFTDYGNTEEVNFVTSVVAITPELDQLAPLAIHCSLLQACSLDQQWTDYDIEQFIATWEGRKVEVEFVESEVIGTETKWVVILRDENELAETHAQHQTSQKLSASPSYVSKPPSKPSTYQATTVTNSAQSQTSTVYQGNAPFSASPGFASEPPSKPSTCQATTVTSSAPSVMPQSQTSTVYQGNAPFSASPGFASELPSKPSTCQATTVTSSAPSVMPQSQTSAVYQGNAPFSASPGFASEPPSKPSTCQATTVTRSAQSQTSTVYQGNAPFSASPGFASDPPSKPSTCQATTVTSSAPSVMPQSQTNTVYQGNAPHLATPSGFSDMQSTFRSLASNITPPSVPQFQTSTMYQGNAPGFQSQAFAPAFPRVPPAVMPTTHPGMPMTYQPSIIPPVNTMYQANAAYPYLSTAQQPQQFSNTIAFPNGITGIPSQPAQNMAFPGMPVANRFHSTVPTFPFFRANPEIPGLPTVSSFQNPARTITPQANSTFPLAPRTTPRFPFQTNVAPKDCLHNTSYQATPVTQTAFQPHSTADTSYEAKTVPPYATPTGFQHGTVADTSYEAKSVTLVPPATYQEKTVYSAVPTDENMLELPEKATTYQSKTVYSAVTADQAIPSTESTTFESKTTTTNTNSRKRSEITMYVPPALRNSASASRPAVAAVDTPDSSDAAETYIPAPKVDLVIPEMKLPTEEIAVTISCFISPLEFYVQLTNRAAEYDDLQCQIQMASTSLSHPDPMQTLQNELVLAPRETALHRARVVAIKDDKAKCTFLDLGALTKVVRLAKLLPLPDWACEAPVFSLRCKLAGVVPVGSAWELQACQKVFHTSKEYLLTVLNAEEHEVELRCAESGLCVSELLRKAGAATVPDPAENVMLDMEEDYPVFLSFLQGDTLHLQLAKAQKKLELLQQLLQAAAPRLQSFNLDNDENIKKLAAARSQRDGQWYRALPLGSATKEGLPVYFVDFGPRDLVWEVRELSPALASVPYLSVPARLPCSLKPDAYPVLNVLLESPTPMLACVMHQGVDSLVCDLQVSGSSLLQKLLDFSLASPLLGEAYMTYIESPHYFALQPKELEPKLQELEQCLSTERFQPLITPPKVGDLCLAQFTDLSWYRAKVNSTDGPQVLFIDYGNSETVSELRKMSDDMAEIPAMAKFCQLSVIRDNYEEHFMQLSTDEAFQVLWPTDMESQPIKVVLMRDGKDIMPATPHPLQFTLEGFGLSVPLGEQEPEVTHLEPQQHDATEEQANESEPEDGNELNSPATSEDETLVAATEQQASERQTYEAEESSNIDISLASEGAADRTFTIAADESPEKTDKLADEVFISEEEEEEEVCGHEVKDMSDFWNDSGVEDTNKDFQVVEECPKVEVSKSEMQKFAKDTLETPDNWEDISIESSATELEVNEVETGVVRLELDKEKVNNEVADQVKSEDSELKKENVNEEGQVKLEDLELGKEKVNEDADVSQEKSGDSELNKESVNEIEVDISQVNSEYLELEKEELHKTDVSQVNSEYLELEKEELHKTDVSQVNYEYLELENEELHKTDVSQVHSEYLELENEELHKTDVSQVNSEYLELEKEELHKTDVSQVNYEYLELENEELHKTDVSQVNSEYLELENEELHKTDVSQVNSEYLELENEELHKTDVSQVNSEYLELEKEELHKTDVSQVNSEYLELEKEELHKTDVSQVNSEYLELENVELHKKDVSQVHAEDFELAIAMDKLNKGLEDIQTTKHEIDELCAIFGTEKKCDEDAHSDTSTHVPKTELQNTVSQEPDLPQATPTETTQSADDNLPATPPVYSDVSKKSKVSLEALCAPFDDDFNDEPLGTVENKPVSWSLGDPNMLAQYSRDSSLNSRDSSIDPPDFATEMNPDAQDFQPQLNHTLQESVDEYLAAMQRSLESIKQMRLSHENQTEPLRQVEHSSDEEKTTQQLPKKLDQTETTNKLSDECQPPQPVEGKSLDEQQPSEPLKEVESADEIQEQALEEIEPTRDMPEESQGDNQPPEALEVVQSINEISGVHVDNQQSSEALKVEASHELESQPSEVSSSPELSQDRQSPEPPKEVKSADENQEVTEQHLETLKQIESTQENQAENQKPLKHEEISIVNQEVHGLSDKENEKPEAVKDLETPGELQPQPSEVQSTDEMSHGENEPLKQMDFSDESDEYAESALEHVESTQEMPHIKDKENPLQSEETEAVTLVESQQESETLKAVESSFNLEPQPPEVHDMDLSYDQQSPESHDEICENQKKNQQPPESSGDCPEKIKATLEKEIQSLPDLALENQEAILQSLNKLAVLPSKKQESTLEILVRMTPMLSHDESPSECPETSQQSAEATEEMFSEIHETLEALENIESTDKSEPQEDSQQKLPEATTQVQLSGEYQQPSESLDKAVSPPLLATNHAQLFTVESSDESETLEDNQQSEATNQKQLSGEYQQPSESLEKAVSPQLLATTSSSLFTVESSDESETQEDNQQPPEAPNQVQLSGECQLSSKSLEKAMLDRQQLHIELDSIFEEAIEMIMSKQTTIN